MYARRLKSRTNLLKVSLVALAAMLAACLVAVVVRVEPSQAAFPGQNGKIVFRGGGENLGSRGIYTVNPDGSDLIRIFTANFSVDDVAQVVNLSWSPDGSKLVFDYYPLGFARPDIYVMNADGSDLTNLTNTINTPPGQGPVGLEPVWSPDGSKIAFSCIAGICTMNADGSDRHIIVAGGSAPYTWSPDGSKIAFVRSLLLDEKEGSNIYVANADGSNEIALTNNRAHNSEPAWSPDGTKLLLTRDLSDSDRPGTPTLYTVNADGTNLDPLLPEASGPLTGVGEDWQSLSMPKSKADCK